MNHVMFFLLLNVIVESKSDNGILNIHSQESFGMIFTEEGGSVLNISLEFRTFESEGVVLYHKFQSVGHVKIFFKERTLKAEIAVGEYPLVTFKTYSKDYSDGEWHSFQISLVKQQVHLTVENQSHWEKISNSFRTGEIFIKAFSHIEE